MKKKHIINIPIYSCDILCFFDKDKFKKHHDKHIFETDVLYYGAVNSYINKDNKLTIILGVFNDNIAILVHELVHVMSMIFEHYGMKYDNNNDENYAYLMQHIFLEVNQRLYDYHNKGN